VRAHLATGGALHLLLEFLAGEAAQNRHDAVVTAHRMKPEQE
jgi:hypothetical protein